MKKVLVLSLGVLLMMSSCGSYEAAGAFTGAHFGSIVGSAVGGISGGWRGHHVGSLIGMASGAAVGAAIGAAADRAEQERYERRYEGRYEENRGVNARQSIPDESGFDPSGRGDDRISFDGMKGNMLPKGPVNLEISNVRLVDASRDGMLTRGESAHIVFEVSNNSSEPVYGVQPSVLEVTRNKHIHISENVLVECIPAKQAIRYTAQIKADNGLRNGEAVIRVAVFQAGREVTSQTHDYRIATAKR
jgi:hypothetical protein